MAIFNISNEAGTNIASVLSNRALKTAQVYEYTFLPGSAETTGVISSAPCVLHSVQFQDSATATTYLVLSNSASVVGQVGNNSACGVAQFGTITKNTFPMNVALSAGLTYRVTGSAIGPTLITYSVAN